jgi:hypothetical protein
MPRECCPDWVGAVSLIVGSGQVHCLVGASRSVSVALGYLMVCEVLLSLAPQWAFTLTAPRVNISMWHIRACVSETPTSWYDREEGWLCQTKPFAHS